MDLTPADESLFWYWINERHQIYVRRAAGEMKPWTQDPILQTCKFTNVFRQLDRGTVWLTDHFITSHRDDDLALLLFNVAWYRMFNWTGTGELLGWRTEWPVGEIGITLHRHAKLGGQVFTGAHIIHSEVGQPKIDSIVNVCRELFERRCCLVATARSQRRLEAVFDELRTVRHVGGFMAYEIVSDLRWTRVLDDATDINTWANVGPGAMRGLKRLWPDLKPKDALGKMRELLARSRENTGSHVPDMELRDIEHSLCEYSKMCRVKFDGGSTRSKYPGRPA